MSDRAPLRGRRWLRRVTVILLVSALATGRALAHGGSLRSATPEELAIPTWLFLMTGGGVIGASFLLASFVTNRGFIDAVHEWHRLLSVPRETVFALVLKLVGVVGLGAVLYFGLFGPQFPLSNLAILTVWVGWWAGYTISVYLLGNTWEAVNPWRTLAEALPALDAPYPESLGAWPSVAGLLALVWLEVVSPLADQADLLATVVLAYTVVTLTGAVVYGPETWFSTVDPVSRVFRYYGRVAPFKRTKDGLSFRLPGAALSETRFVTGPDEIAFVIAILWVTTYDGLVTTPAWVDFATWLVGLGVPAVILYPAAILAGFALFLGAYRLATTKSIEYAETYLPPRTLANRFAPSLLAIAAGYHLAHFLGYFLSLSPALVTVAASPFSPPPDVPVLPLPSWFGGVNLTFVLLGHLGAIWVAHATAYDLFPSRLQAVRSQYPYIAVMMFYTMVSLWIVAEPALTPPFI
ncbi:MULTISPECIES: hypothetical protein [unclassified Haladaptatus]|uniref:hypothetical protein n=1 Tax=unclassified Haladaptatus TaxID=2622732 RepID=UPI0023E7F461|nr:MULTISPECIES: hypothetical protein [unclassified Haladaptatus]